MVKEVQFINWKSFKEATIYIDPFTILIGTNASGKSNAIEGLGFLNKMISGRNLEYALTGYNRIGSDTSFNEIRGGKEWAARKPGNEFGFKVIIEKNEDIDYEYSITVRTKPKVELVSESLYYIDYSNDEKRSKLYTTKRKKRPNQESIKVKYGEVCSQLMERCTRDYKNTYSILSQIKSQSNNSILEEAITNIVNKLEKIFVFEPIPSRMRNYSLLSVQLTRSGSNIAGVLASLPEGRKEEVENLLSEYLSRLPEGDIEKVWAEKIGRLENDSMLYCQEKWVKDKEPLIADARGMSDGTLRFLGILTALLTRPEDSLIVIEEVDIGLHPSRAHLLFQMLDEIGRERSIDILVTTHNSALLDELGSEMYPFVTIAHRSPDTGDSELTLLEEMDRLPKILSFGSLGKISRQGYIEKALHDEGGSDSE